LVHGVTLIRSRLWQRPGFGRLASGPGAGARAQTPGSGLSARTGTNTRTSTSTCARARDRARGRNRVLGRACRYDQRRAPGHPAGGDQRQAAERDARQDGQAARDLHQPDRVAERHHAGDGADQRLEVQEGPGDLGRHPALAEREQGERR
jgi:hypothetical protein